MVPAAAAEPADPAAVPGKRPVLLLAVSVALFMVLMDNTVVNVAVPSIQRSLHASLGTLEWTVNAYTLAIAVFLVTGGRLGDLLGRRRVFVAGIVLFALASAAVAAAPSSAAIVAARAGQGVAAAALMPGTLSILSAAYPREQRGRAIGIWSGVAGISLVIGPLLGGAIIELVSWRAIFLINVPVSVLAVALTFVSIRESRDHHEELSFDVPGIVTLSLALGAVTLATIEGNNWGWGSTRILVLFAVSIVAFAAFIAAERRARAPILDLGWMRSRRISGPNLASAALAFAMFGMLFFITIYLQRVLGYNPLKAGAAFLPATVVAALCAPLAGWLSDRIGTSAPTIVGLTLAAAAMWIASGVTTTSGYGLMVPAFVLLGAAIAFVIAPTSTAVMNAVSEARAGVASGVVSMTRMVGGTFGVAVLGAVFQSVGRDRIQESFVSLGLPLPKHVDLVKGLGDPSTLPVPPQARAALGERITTAAHDALIHALANAMLVGAGISLAFAICVWLLLRPGRSATEGARAAEPARPQFAKHARPLSGHLSDG
jgi:EmrB/QacA subfamily drug resistance transporter